MLTLPIPYEDQIISLLDGSIYELLCQYYVNPSQYIFKDYLTINRQMITDFLEKHPQKSEQYFKKVESNPNTHDVDKILKEREGYSVVWMDHGKPRFPVHFKNLSEAVAEHVLVSYGMY